MVSDSARDPEGVRFEDGRLGLRDGRTLAWRLWGEPEDEVIVRLQGVPGSRLGRPGLGARGTLGVRLLMVDRPGFGCSTRLPGRGLRVVAEDLAELLDELGVASAPVIANSGGAPHALALAACYPNRVRSLTVVNGACPVTPSERAGLERVNAQLGALLDEGWDAVHAYLIPIRQRLLDEGMRALRADAPAQDVAKMTGKTWALRDSGNRHEALRQGTAGWADETLAINSRWDFELADVRTHIDWWHGASDRAVPLSAAQRLTALLPDCDLHVLAHHGHNVGLMPMLDQLAGN